MPEALRARRLLSVGGAAPQADNWGAAVDQSAGAAPVAGGGEWGGDQWGSAGAAPGGQWTA